MQKLGARLHVASQAGKPRHTLSVAPPEEPSGTQWIWGSWGRSPSALRLQSWTSVYGKQSRSEYATDAGRKVGQHASS